MVDDSLTPNRKVRRTGTVLLVLAGLGYVGAATGWDAHGAGGRIVLAVVSTVLLLFGALLFRTRMPAITAIRADRSGLRFEVAGDRTATIAWSDVEAVWLRQLGTIFRGYLLHFEYTDQASRPTALRPFERVTSGGVRVLIGLNSQQAATLRTELPAAAGSRYHEGAPS